MPTSTGSSSYALSATIVGIGTAPWTAPCVMKLSSVKTCRNISTHTTKPCLRPQVEPSRASLWVGTARCGTPYGIRMCSALPTLSMKLAETRPFPNNWEMKRWLGERDTNPKRWDEYTVINQLDKLKDGGLSIIVDCGTKDFFFEVNNNLHSALIQHGIRHTYLITPGQHDTPYWRNCLEYETLFFNLFFTT